MGSEVLAVSVSALDPWWWMLATPQGIVAPIVLGARLWGSLVLGNGWVTPPRLLTPVDDYTGA